MNFTFPKLTSAVKYFVNEQSVFKPLKCISNRKFHHVLYKQYQYQLQEPLTISRSRCLTFSLADKDYQFKPLYSDTVHSQVKYSEVAMSAGQTN